MSKIIYKSVDSIDEYVEAYEVSFKIFSSTSVLNSYKEYKHNSWVNDPYADHKNIYIAKSDGRVIGLIRIVPREIYINTIPLKLAGISSVCLLPEFQGKGLSVPLMERTLLYATESGYDVSALFARRSADYYYNRFGFFGLASYSKLFLKKEEQNINIGYELSDLDLEDIDIYANAYMYSYEKCSGYILRTSKYWLFLLSSLKFRKEISFKSIKLNSATIGYVIYSDNQIHEISLIDNSDGFSVVNFLNDKLSKEQLIIKILPQHKLVPFLTKKDVVYQTRECYYGGHMMRILNIESVLRKFGYSGCISSLSAKPFLQYNELCEVLKIWTPSLNQIGYLPFDICEMDHF